MTKKQQARKVKTVMGEWKAGKLKSSSGAKVTTRKQAMAIAMSKSGQSKSRHEMHMSMREASDGGKKKF